LKDLALADRPREKLLRHGAAAMGDNELVALVVGFGCRGVDALTAANALLGKHGGLRGLARSNCGEISGVAGIGLVKAVRLMAGIELGRRTLAHSAGDRVQLRTPRDAAAFLLPSFSLRPVEQFGIVLLDTKHRVLKTTIVASGTLNATVVEPRDVFREAVTGSAAALVAFHNHPSGDPSPSPDDTALTRRLSAAGVLMGIELVDHIVLGDGRYFSYRETNQL
jgi:DNA repair protein RadC